MGYVTLKKLNGSDVENVLEFCNVISGPNKPYHVDYQTPVKAIYRPVARFRHLAGGLVLLRPQQLHHGSLIASKLVKYGLIHTLVRLFVEMC